MRDALREGYRMAQAKKTATIAALKGTGRCMFSDDELNAMSQQELDRLTTLAQASQPAQVVDFSGRALPRTSANAGVPKPPSLVDLLQNKKAATS
jgi:hypothetical protein